MDECKPLVEGMVCPPDTNVTAIPNATSINCTCGIRTACAEPNFFGRFDRLGNGSYLGDLTVPRAGNNSVYVYASYTELTGNSGGFGDSVERLPESPVRVLIVPNVLSVRSIVLKTPNMYTAGGTMQFQIQAIDQYANYITHGGEGAALKTFTDPEVRRCKLKPLETRIESAWRQRLKLKYNYCIQTLISITISTCACTTRRTTARTTRRRTPWMTC